MKQIYKILTLVFLLALTGGCKNWLEIESKSEIAADVLFDTPEGFSIALNGVYTMFSSRPLYGKELKFDFLDVLARVYDTQRSQYDGLKEYDYVSNGMDMMIQNIWSNGYNAIANCNALLEQLESKPDGFFTAAERNMLEGEALTLRALLYLDLLRLFAPAPVVADEAAIPYYGALSNAPMPYRKTSEILDYILNDLKRSKEIQRGYDATPEAKGKFKTQRFRVDEGFYGNSKRAFRMGYYATTALLARTALYAGDRQLALENAMELINDKVRDGEPTIVFTPATRIDVGEYDRLLSEDIIFALYQTNYEDRFNNVIFLMPNTGSIYGADLNSDYRRKAYFTAEGRQLLKYDLKQDREGDITSAIPMIRLSEMYHIAAEASYEEDPEVARDLLNQLRTHRGATIALPSFPNKESFLNALINDGRREYVGEGQLFFMYKRLNATVLDEYGGHQTLTDEFVLPVPDREISEEN